MKRHAIPAVCTVLAVLDVIAVHTYPVADYVPHTLWTVWCFAPGVRFALWLLQEFRGGHGPGKDPEPPVTPPGPDPLDVELAEMLRAEAEKERAR